MTNQHAESAERVITRNAQTVDGAPTQAPDQTVAHGMAVEARLVQAIAARKKKERTAGGKSAAELAESILAGGLVQSRSTAEGEPAQGPSLHEEDLLAATPSGLEFLDDDDLAPPALDETSLQHNDDLMAGLFGDSAEAAPEPEVIDQKCTPKLAPVPRPCAVTAATNEPTHRDKVPENRDRLKSLLRKISGKS
jgi:hypothetical protein